MLGVVSAASAQEADYASLRDAVERRVDADEADAMVGALFAEARAIVAQRVRAGIAEEFDGLAEASVPAESFKKDKGMAL